VPLYRSNNSNQEIFLSKFKQP